MTDSSSSNPSYIRSSEENAQHITEITERLESLTNIDKAKIQQLQTQTEQLQQRLQTVGNAIIGTRGQISELEDHLLDQERDKHRLEGALDVLQAMNR